MQILAEGIESLKLACSLVLLIPAVGVVLMGRRRTWLVPTWIFTVSLVAWLTFVGWFTAVPSGPVHVLVGIALLGLTFLAWRRDALPSDLGATVVAAFLAAWTWIPCVGRELGDILNNARAEPWAELAPTMLYFVGLFLPLIIVAAVDVAWPKIAAFTDAQWVRAAGLTIVGLVGFLVAITLFDDVAGELVRRSSF